MSAPAAAVPGPRPLRAPRVGSGATPARPVLMVAAFGLLALYAALEYARLLVAAPVGRVLGVVAVATAAAAALAYAERLPRRTRAAAGAAMLVLALALCLLALGVPARRAWPWGWGSLAKELSHGVRGLEGWLWPYRGGAPETRLAVLAVVPVALLGAAALCFWPSDRARAGRRLAAYGVLVALLIAGVANAPAGVPAVKGLLLLGLSAMWLWAPAARGQAARAAAWLLPVALVALLGRPLLSSSRPWISYRDPPAAEAATASFEWDQTYGPMPWSRSKAVMFEIQESHPALLRVTSLDRFDGVAFVRSANPPGSLRADLGRRTQVPVSEQARATFSVAGLRSTLLAGGDGVPVFSRWLAPGGGSIQRGEDGTLSSASGTEQGTLYEVSSYRPSAGPAALRAAPPTFPAAYMPYVQFQLPTPGGGAQPSTGAATVGPVAPGLAPAADPAVARRIEASPYGRVFALARRLAAGSAGSYEVAERVERFLLGGYRYDEHVAAARYPLASFLFAQHAGYCQQFSGAMTLLLRMDGIPARVGAGFKPLLYDPVRATWQVRAVDAHAWVEVFFAGVGWIDFDPTPPGGAASVGFAPSLAKAKLLGTATPAAAAHRTSAARAAAAVPGGTGRGGDGALLPALLSAAALLAAAVALLGALRLRRLLDGDGGAAVAELARALRVPHAGGEQPTLNGLERRLHAGGERIAAGYVAALRERRYGRAGGSAPTRRGRAALRRALARGTGFRGRLRLLAALPPGTTRRVR